MELNISFSFFFLLLPLFWLFFILRFLSFLQTCISDGTDFIYLLLFFLGGGTESVLLHIGHVFETLSLSLTKRSRGLGWVMVHLRQDRSDCVYSRPPTFGDPRLFLHRVINRVEEAPDWHTGQQENIYFIEPVCHIHTFLSFSFYLLNF